MKRLPLNLLTVATLAFAGIGSLSSLRAQTPDAAPDGTPAPATPPAAAPADGAPTGGGIDDPPRNLARAYGVGATVDAFKVGPNGSTEKADSSVGNLLSGEPTKNFNLTTGTTVVVVDLHNGYNLQSLKFRNGGATGNVTIATAPTKIAGDKGWTTNPTPVPLTGSGMVDLSMGSGAAGANTPPAPGTPAATAPMRFVKITFNVETPGQIGSFGVFSDLKVSQMPVIQAYGQKGKANDVSPQVEPVQPVNLASDATGAKIVYVSSLDNSGEKKNDPQNLVSEDAAKDFSFHPTDNNPITAVKLADPRKLVKFEMTVTNPVGMNLYLSDGAPVAGSTWKDMIAKRKADFNIAQATKTVSVDLKNQKALYVVVAFNGNPGPIADMTVLSMVPSSTLVSYGTHNPGDASVAATTAAAAGQTGSTSSSVAQGTVSVDRVVDATKIPPVVAASN